MDESLRQQVVNDEHLKILRIGYLVSAGTSAFMGLFGFIYVFMGVMVTRMPSGQGQGPPAFFGWFFAIFGLAFVAGGLGLGVLKFYAASCLKQRRSRTFCMVVAGITCLGMPYGTLLGVLTFIVLSRPAVSRLFDGDGVVSAQS
jgi:hypothetical protein